MTDDVFGGATNQHMFEAGGAVRGGHNQIRAAIFCPFTDLLSGVTNLK
jgi:hypothetical protein